METVSQKGGLLKEVDGVEIISLVDNTIDFLSAVKHKNVKLFRQWTKERYGPVWFSTHKQLPLAEHGFSVLIRAFNEAKSDNLLFDTGCSPDIAVENAKRMGLKLKEVECIVLSHGHFDHFGGLTSVVKEINRSGIPIIVHEDMFKSRGSENSKGVVRQYTDFPTTAQLSSACLVTTKKPYLVAHDKVCVTGEIPRTKSFETGFMRHRVLIDNQWQSDPLILDDRGVVLNVKRKGLVIVSGCAHAGIINTVNYAKQITGVSEVYAVIGGFHLAGKENEKRVEPTISELKRINPKLVVSCHCTGWRAMCAMAREIPETLVWNSVGNLYEV